MRRAGLARKAEGIQAEGGKEFEVLGSKFWKPRTSDLEPLYGAEFGVHPMAQGSSPTEPFDVSVNNKLTCPVFAVQDLSGSSHLHRMERGSCGIYRLRPFEKFAVLIDSLPQHTVQVRLEVSRLRPS